MKTRNLSTNTASLLNSFWIDLKSVAIGEFLARTSNAYLGSVLIARNHVESILQKDGLL